MYDTEKIQKQLCQTYGVNHFDPYSKFGYLEEMDEEFGYPEEMDEELIYGGDPYDIKDLHIRKRFLDILWQITDGMKIQEYEFLGAATSYYGIHLLKYRTKNPRYDELQIKITEYMVNDRHNSDGKNIIGLNFHLRENQEYHIIQLGLLDYRRKKSSDFWHDFPTIIPTMEKIDWFNPKNSDVQKYFEGDSKIRGEYLLKYFTDERKWNIILIRRNHCEFIF